MDYLASELVSRVKEESYFPPGITDARILSWLNREYYSTIVPLIRNAKQEHLVRSVDVAASTNGNLIPSRAMGGVLREISIVSGNSERNCPRIEIDDIPDNYGFGFYVKGNRIFFLNNNANQSARLYFYLDPSEIVLESECALISSISADRLTYTCSSVPATWAANDDIDIVQGKPQFDLLAYDVNVSAISGSNVVFAADPSADAVAGDYIALARKTPIPNIPYPAFDALIQGAAFRILKAKGDPRLEPVKMEYEEAKGRIKDLISPRVDGEAKIISGYRAIYRPGIFRT